MYAVLMVGVVLGSALRRPPWARRRKKIGCDKGKEEEGTADETARSTSIVQILGLEPPGSREVLQRAIDFLKGIRHGVEGLNVVSRLYEDSERKVCLNNIQCIV